MQLEKYVWREMWLVNESIMSSRSFASNLHVFGVWQVHGHVGGCPLRPGRRVDDRPARSSHCLQFLHVLQSHAGNRISRHLPMAHLHIFGYKSASNDQVLVVIRFFNQVTWRRCTKRHSQAVTQPIRQRAKEATFVVVCHLQRPLII